MDVRPDGPEVEFPYLTAALRHYEAEFQYGNGDKTQYEVYQLFKNGLRDFSSTPGSMPRRSYGEVTHQATIIDVSDRDAIQHEYHSISLIDTEPNGLVENTRMFARKLSFSLTHHYEGLKYRILVVHTRDTPDFDLYFMDVLRAVFDLSLPLLWHIFRVQHYWPHENDLRSPDAALQREHAMSPWSQHRLFALSKTSVLFLEHQDAVSTTTIPHAIVFLKESYLDTNPYDGDPLSASDNLDSPGGISSHIQAAVLHSKLFNWSGNAQKVYSETNDARQGLLAAYVESAALENIQNPIVPCMKFLLQHHVKACRLVLAEHERPYWGYRRIEQQGPGWHNRPGSEELPGSWQRLERLLQHLKSQKIAVMRLRATSPEITGTRLEHELEEFELLIEEMAAVVGHKRARLDHQLNETLLLESRANLKVANMTIKESRGTRMLTILAFIFIPFSLATSIFGMNLQELNQSGSTLGHFLITAFTLFLGAIIVWILGTFVSRAVANWTQRTYVVSARRPLFPAQGPELIKKVLRYPQSLWTFWREDVLLGVITLGRYDLQGFIYAYFYFYGDIREAPRQWTRGFMKKQLRYLLGFERLPDNETYESLRRVRAEDHEYEPGGLD